MKQEKTNKMEICPCFDGQNVDNNSQNKGMMNCMKSAKWFLLIPGVLIIAAFVLGYILDPAVVRTLWLIITGALVVLGTIFYTLVNLWVNRLKSNSVH